MDTEHPDSERLKASLSELVAAARQRREAAVLPRPMIRPRTPKACPVCWRWHLRPGEHRIGLHVSTCARAGTVPRPEG